MMNCIRKDSADREIRLEIHELASKIQMLAYLLAGILRMLGKMHTSILERRSMCTSRYGNLPYIARYVVNYK